jgi:hypothetical protein
MSAPTPTARLNKPTLVEIRDLNGNAIHPERPLPTLRRTPSGRLFLPRETSNPPLYPRALKSKPELNAIDTVCALIPPTQTFSSRQDEYIVIRDTPAQKISIVDLPPKLNACAPRTQNYDRNRNVLRRQRRMREGSEGVRRRSCVGNVEGVWLIEPIKDEVRSLHGRNSLDIEDGLGALLTYPLHTSSCHAQKESVHLGTHFAPETGWWSTAGLTRLALLRNDMSWDNEVEDMAGMEGGGVELCLGSCSCLHLCS